jgi:hypothetical protein
MTKYLYLLTLVFLTSCGQTNNNSKNSGVVNSDSVTKTIENTSARKFQLTDKTVKFLWRANKYDEGLHDTFNSIFIDEDFCKTITDPERAALGYVATFIGNECWWDGEGNDDRSNLKCKILTALNLGYQCSDKHLGFLRQWFKDDKKSLEELENCPTTPYTATIQDTFDEITLTVKGNKISVSFKANGVNIREGDSWSWTETDHFQFDNDNIKLIKKDESKVKREHIETGE